MPSRARRSATSAPSTYGSHNSPAEIQAIMPEQHAVLAAAATRKSGKQPTVTRAPAGIRKAGKNLFSFKKLPRAGSSGDGKRRKSGKNDAAMISFVRARFQKGTKDKELTGTVYAHFKPRYGNNDKCKEKIHAKSLMETTRWNDELKVYRLRAWSVEQAIMYREAMKMVSEEDEADINKTAPTDEEIAEVFNFPEAKELGIHKMPVTIAGQEMIGFGGTTVAFKDEFKERGFSFHRNVINDALVQLWVAPIDTDTTDLEGMFEEYGFPLEEFDGVDECDDDDDDE